MTREEAIAAAPFTVLEWHEAAQRHTAPNQGLTRLMIRVQAPDDVLVIDLAVPPDDIPFARARIIAALTRWGRTVFESCVASATKHRLQMLQPR